MTCPSSVDKNRKKASSSHSHRATRNVLPTARQVDHARQIPLFVSCFYDVRGFTFHCLFIRRQACGHLVFSARRSRRTRADPRRRVGHQSRDRSHRNNGWQDRPTATGVRPRFPQGTTRDSFQRDRKRHLFRISARLSGRARGLPCHFQCQRAVRHFHSE